MNTTLLAVVVACIGIDPPAPGVAERIDRHYKVMKEASQESFDPQKYYLNPGEYRRWQDLHSGYDQKRSLSTQAWVKAIKELYPDFAAKYPTAWDNPKLKPRELEKLWYDLSTGNDVDERWMLLADSGPPPAKLTHVDLTVDSVPSAKACQHRCQWAAVRINGSNYPNLSTTVSHLLAAEHYGQVQKWETLIRNLHRLPDQKEALQVAWGLHDYCHGVAVEIDTNWLNRAEAYYRKQSSKTASLPSTPRYEWVTQCLGGQCRRVRVRVK